LLISEQTRRRIADEQLGIAAVHPQHFNRLVTGLVADLQEAHPRFTALVTSPDRKLWAPNADTSNPSRAAPALTMVAMARPVGADTLIALIPHSDEHRATRDAAGFNPCLQRRNRASRGAARNGNGLA
jgi:hypothetical protein